MQLSPLDAKQWKSVALNSLFTFISVALVFVSNAVVQGTPLNWALLISAASAGFMAVMKLIEKLLTPTN